jgi:hypothetical protein
MKNSFPYQFLINLVLASDHLRLNRYLRELADQQEYRDQQGLEQFFLEELKESSLQRQEDVDYYQFLVHNALGVFLHRADFDQFEQVIELLRHRMPALHNAQVEINMKAWEVYISFIEIAFRRVLRNVAIEQFEQQLDNLNWEVMDKDFLASISRLIGYVYMHEDQKEQAAKARLWLQKALYESEAEEKLLVFLYLGSYYHQHGGEDRTRQISELVNQVREVEVDERLRNLFKAAAFQLNCLTYSLNEKENKENRLEEAKKDLEDLINRFKKFREVNDLPAFVNHEITSILARHYISLAQAAEEPAERPELVQPGLEMMDEVIEDIDPDRLTDQHIHYRLVKAEIASWGGVELTEKELKEIVQHYRRDQHFPHYLKAQSTFARIHDNNGNHFKSYDLILEAFKQGNRRMDQGGFYLLLGGLRLGNEVFAREVQKAGVSWMTEKLDDFFTQVQETLDLIPGQMEEIGKAWIEEFREAFFDFEPYSHYNILTYFRYQLYEIKAMKIGAQLSKDPLSERIANRLLNEINDENNPLNFIHAKWEEFKKVPNEVRNNTLNKCINISKGDLPRAAEHLDFSYRNLRSYITFKEVNRLGFFLNVQQTHNKQLEQGIRFMFYDLYKKGTIFEVVFDMPRFLVRHSRSGFFSQDLEKELNIKGTTAKKYLKIMMEIGLIRQDKTLGRKHFYQLIRENVMKRLGQDQGTLISPDS